MRLRGGAESRLSSMLSSTADTHCLTAPYPLQHSTTLYSSSQSTALRQFYSLQHLYTPPMTPTPLPQIGHPPLVAVTIIPVTLRGFVSQLKLSVCRVVDNPPGPGPKNRYGPRSGPRSGPKPLVQGLHNKLSRETTGGQTR